MTVRQDRLSFLGSYKLNYVDGEGVDHGFDSARSAWGSVRDMNLSRMTMELHMWFILQTATKLLIFQKLNEEYTGLATEPDKAVEGVDFTRNFINWSREAPAMFKYKDKYYIINSGCTGWSPNPAQYAVADNPLGPWTSMGDPCSDEGKKYDLRYTEYLCNTGGCGKRKIYLYGRPLECRRFE